MGTRRATVMKVVVILTAGILLASCDVNSSRNGASEAARSPNAPIKLGGTLPLTGPFSDTGCWIERGYRYWAEEANSKGGLLGRRVELVIYDDAGSPGEAVSLFEQAITDDKVDLLLGGYPGTAAALQMPAAERHRMVYVSMGGHMPSFEQGFTFSFGGPPLMGQWWYEGLWQWLAGLPVADRPHRMATISVNNLVGLSIRESAMDGSARLGIEVAMDELYDLPFANAREVVARAKDTGADLFIASGFLPDGILTVRAMKALDYNPKCFVQGIGSLVPRWTEELGDDGDYVFSASPIHPRLPFQGVKELDGVATRRFDVREAPSYFLFGYAWLQTLQAGVEGAGSLSQTAIRDYLRSHGISTIGGYFTFDKRGLPKPYNYLTQVRHNWVELVWPPEIRTTEPVYPKPPWKH
jgi:branched-chain amino acid transport system substrate-binding protein